LFHCLERCWSVAGALLEEFASIRAIKAFDIRRGMEYGVLRVVERVLLIVGIDFDTEDKIREMGHGNSHVHSDSNKNNNSRPFRFEKEKEKKK
jgi:hypothetical protein